MKKRILSAVLVSGVTLGTAAVTVNADDYDTQIAAQDAVISNLTSEQAAAQSKVDAIQSQVSSLQSQQADLEAQNAQLEAESQKLSEEIQALSSKIVARNETLKNQARNAQKNASATSYINTILNSKSVSDAINRVQAIREVVAANKKMLDEQEADKAAIEQKQAENQEAINTVAANKATIEQNQAALATQQAELQAAQLDLSAQLATAEDERANLVAQKEAAEQAAAEAAAAQAAAEAQAQAESVAQAQAAVQNGTATTDTTTDTSAQDSSAAAPAQQASTPAQAAPAQQASTSAQSAPAQTAAKPAASTSSSAAKPSSVTPTTNTAGNTYPVGQCTWGVKSLASWVGNYWGNANQWIASAQAAGHSVGTTPQAGAVAVWPYDGGGYGHVAYVTAVQSSTNIQVMEANYAGNSSIGNYRGWFNPTSSTWGGGTVYYIYQ